MQKLLILAVIATITLSGMDAHASGRRVRQVSANQGQGPVSRLVELERRKNAALRQMFFGR